MPEMIIGSPAQHTMAVNNSGAVPIAAYSGGTIYPLLVDDTGRLETTANVTTGSESYIPAGSVIVTNRVAGSIVNMPAVAVTTGSEVWVKAGSIQPYTQLGSVEVWQTSNADLQVQATQETSPWVVSGNVMVSGVISNLDEVSVDTGSEVWVKAGSIQPYTQLGSVEIWQKTAADLTVSVDTPKEVGSLAVQTVDGTVTVTGIATAGSLSTQTVSGIVDIGNFGDLGSSVVVENLYTGSEVWMPIGSAHITNAGDVGGYPGSNLWVTPSGTFAVDTSLTVGSEVWMPAGSVIVTNRVAGSIVNMPAVNVTTGSEVWVKAGSIQPYTQLGSVEIWQKTAADLIVDIGDIGSVRAIVSDPKSIGSLSTQTVDGTVTVTDIATAGSLSIQAVSGIVDIGNRVAGSIVNLPDEIGVSGTYFQNIIGSVSQNTDPWIVLGSIAQTNTGSVIQSTSPWAVSGVVNTELYAGSESWIKNEIVLEDVGSPCFKRGILTASGTYTDAWEVEGAGSKLEMHGFHISTNLAGYVRILRSGTTPVVIADYNLNYASGAVIEKTFVTPIIPGGADINTGFGATVAGSTLVTIYGREIK